MNIYTSYFANVRRFPPDVIPVSIALYQPKRWAGTCLHMLAPSKSILNAYHENHDEEAYIASYSYQLHQMHAQAVVEALRVMFEDRDIVLLCYEKPSAFCHRHLVAEWLKANGIPCEEWTEAHL